MEDLKKWFRSYLQYGKGVNIFLIIFCITFSGVGYLFMNKNQNVLYFNERINFKKEFLDAFYQGSSNYYLIEKGKAKEAEKHGIILSKEYISNYIKNMNEFKTLGKFDEKKYQEFLTKYKITNHDVWEYAELKSKIDLLNNIIDPVNSEHKSLHEVLKNSKFLEEISGIQYIINDDYIDEKVKEVMDKLTKEELIIFARENAYKLNLQFVKPEERSGFLIVISEDITNINKDLLKFIIRSNLNQKNAAQKIEKEFNIKINIIPIEKTQKDTTVSELIFKNIDLYKRGEKIIIPIAEKVYPPKIINLSGNLEEIRKQYEIFLYREFGDTLAIDLATKINSGQIKEEDLNKFCRKKFFSKKREELNGEDMLFVTLSRNQALSFSNIESRSCIFICKNKKFRTSMFNGIDKYQFNNFMKKQQENELMARLINWIQQFDRQ